MSRLNGHNTPLSADAELLLNAVLDELKERGITSKPTAHRIDLPAPEVHNHVDVPSVTNEVKTPEIHNTIETGPLAAAFDRFAETFEKVSKFHADVLDRLTDLIKAQSETQEQYASLFSQLLEALAKQPQPLFKPVINIPETKISANMPAPTIELKFPKIKEVRSRFERDKDKDVDGKVDEYTYEKE